MLISFVQVKILFNVGFLVKLLEFYTVSFVKLVLKLYPL